MRLPAPAYSLFAVLATARAISLIEPRDESPRVVKFELQRNRIKNPITHDRDRLKRRDKTLSADLQNLQTLYTLNISLGTPEQQFSVNIDTGSSDLWVNSADSNLCQRSSRPCRDYGTYDANSSSTSDYVGSYFDISYVDGSGASGDYVTDTLRLDDHTISGFQFGVGYDSSSPQGILGIGYPINEAQVQSGRDSYENLPAKLASEGLIGSNAYSLWLNDLEANTGNLLFGGVDRAQYMGDLVTLPIQRSGGGDNGPHAEFFVTLNALELDGDSLGKDMALAVLLDSGTTLTYLPADMVATIYDSVGAAYSESQQAAVVSCDLATVDANMTFHFDSPARIDVPVSELVLDTLGDTNGNSARSTAGRAASAACLFGIAPATDTAVLGDTFLRSAYVVFDMDNNEVSIAQSRLNASGEDVVEIGGGKDPVPSSVDSSDNVDATAGLPGSPKSSEGGSEDDDDDDGVGSLVPSMMGMLSGVLVVVFSCLLM